MVGGVGTATEDEEDVNPAEARKWIEDPDLLLNLQNSPILEKIRRCKSGIPCMSIIPTRTPYHANS